MSLINEALKRAEQDKLRNIARMCYMPTLPPIHETRRIRFSVPVGGALIVAILAVGSFAAWRLTGLLPDSGTPGVAKASTAPKHRANPVTETILAEPVTAASPAPTKEQTSVEPLPETPAPELPAVASEPETIAVAEAAVKEAFDKLVENAAVPAAAPPASPDKPQETPTQVAAEPAAPAASEPEPKPEPEPKKPEPKAIDYSKYKVTGIMRNSDGGTAIINGFFVKVGQTVEDATVISIRENSVVMEIDGQKFTVRM